jgi:DNA primase
VGDGQPKYLSAAGMKKSQLLYGLPQAVQTEGPIVICEGVTGVWRLMTNGVAIFGKSLSAHQPALTLRYFPNRPLVVFLDPDADDEAQEAVRALRMSRRAADNSSSVVIASPPAGREDIGACRFEEVWRQVADALGVPGGKLLRRVKRAIAGRTQSGIE